MPDDERSRCVVIALNGDFVASTLANRVEHFADLARLIPSATWVAIPVPDDLRDPGKFARLLDLRAAVEKFDPTPKETPDAEQRDGS